MLFFSTYSLRPSTTNSLKTLNPLSLGGRAANASSLLCFSVNTTSQLAQGCQECLRGNIWMYTWAPCQPLPPSAAQTQAQGLVPSPLEAEGTRLESLHGGWWKHLKPMPAQGEHLWSWQGSQVLRPGLLWVWLLWSQSWPVGGGAEGCGCLFKRGQDFLLHSLIALQVISPASGEKGQTVKITE